MSEHMSEHVSEHTSDHVSDLASQHAPLRMLVASVKHSVAVAPMYAARATPSIA